MVLDRPRSHRGGGRAHGRKSLSMVSEVLEFTLSTQDTCSAASPDGLASGLNLKCFNDKQR
jgi:hypothetical protein